jgi:DNA-binding transcriptional regulator YhcF (GntR family)
MRNLRISNTSDSPKYRQIIDHVIHNIGQGKLKRGEQLPSIAALSASQKTAKVTIAKAYEILREQGLILSRHGKGFYVASNEVKVKLNIFILFDTFNAYKEILYNAFKEALPANTHCSIFFHHYDITQFRSYIKNSVGKYNYYIVMPHFDEDVSKIINIIPKEKLLLIDKDVANVKGDYAAVYQDFEPDVFNALQQGLQLLKKYKSLQLIAGREHFQYVPSEILKGFTKFCKKHTIHSAIQENLVEKNIKQHHAYLIFSDSDLIRFIKFCNSKKWKLGKDIGLISYDETPMKEILLNGITVISTDFRNMGLKAAELILEKKKEKVANAARMIIRKTL